MAYLTQTEIENAIGAGELIDLADRDNDGVADPAVVSQAIDRATGVVDSYLQSRYALPLAETPDLIRECALALVRYTLAEDHATDRIKDDRDQALTWLVEIREGKMDLGLTPADAATPSATGGARIKGGRPVFDEDMLDTFSGRCE